MKPKDLLDLYEQMKNKHGNNAYMHISELLSEAKEIHKKDFMQSDTAKRAIKEGRVPDHEQSWRAFKGKNLERINKY